MTAAPLSALELRDAVRHGQRFDPARLDRFLYADSERGIAEVQAQTAWKTVAVNLLPGDADALRVGATLPTVGTSVAWNAAGPDGRPAVDHVEALALVTPDGELRRASRAANADLFALAIGGQGVLGTLYSVTLRIESLLRSLGEVEMAEVRHAGAVSGPVRGLQLLLPPGAAEAFVADVQNTCAAWRVRIARLKLRRTKPDGETFLRWAREPYVQISLWLAIPPTLGGAVRTAQLCAELIGLSIARGGSFSLAHTTDATREQVEACYPTLRQFLGEKRRVDPTDRIITPWYRHYRSLLGRQACESRWNR
jgi:hypothetical protein